MIALFSWDFKAWKSKFDCNLDSYSVNIRLMKILHINWKQKFWIVASVYKHVHAAIKKETFDHDFCL